MCSLARRSTRASSLRGTGGAPTGAAARSAARSQRCGDPPSAEPLEGFTLQPLAAQQQLVSYDLSMYNGFGFRCVP